MRGGASLRRGGVALRRLEPRGVRDDRPLRGDDHAAALPLPHPRVHRRPRAPPQPRVQPRRVPAGRLRLGGRAGRAARGVARRRGAVGGGPPPAVRRPRARHGLVGPLDALHDEIARVGIARVGATARPTRQGGRHQHARGRRHAPGCGRRPWRRPWWPRRRRRRRHRQRGRALWRGGGGGRRGARGARNARGGGGGGGLPAVAAAPLRRAHTPLDPAALPRRARPHDVHALPARAPPRARRRHGCRRRVERAATHPRSSARGPPSSSAHGTPIPSGNRAAPAVAAPPPRRMGPMRGLLALAVAA